MVNVCEIRKGYNEKDIKLGNKVEATDMDVMELRLQGYGGVKDTGFLSLV